MDEGREKAGAGTVTSVAIVGSGEKVKWSQKADALVIEPSAGYPSEDAVVYKIGCTETGK